MSLDEKFEKAAEKFRQISEKVSKEDWLEVYGFYKQAIDGDNYRGRPSMVDFRGRDLWQAWYNLIGMEPIEAKEKYIALVSQLTKEHF